MTSQKMRNILLALLLFIAPLSAASSPKAAQALTTWTSQVVPLVIVGEGWSQRIVLSNVDEKWNTTGQIFFYDQTGQPWNVSTTNMGTNSVFNFTLAVGRSMMVDLVPSFATQKLGWAVIQSYYTGNTSANDFSGTGDMFGQVIFRKQSPGLPDFMCSMILGGQSYSKLTTFFDNTGSNYTGMAILTSDNTSTSTSSVPLHVTVRDINGTVISEKTIQQKHKTLYWMNLGIDFPETVGRVGTFEVVPDSKFSAELTGFSLQFAGNGAFTVVTPFEW